MINANSIAVPQEVKENEPATERKFGPSTPARVLSFLYERAEGMDVDELKFLSRATEAARFMASQLGETVSNIGCLIDNDFQPGKMRAGNFEDGHNVANLLFAIADQVNVISELAYIGSECEFALRLKGVKNV